jgi:hypothetical protein
MEYVGIYNDINKSAKKKSASKYRYVRKFVVDGEMEDKSDGEVADCTLPSFWALLDSLTKNTETVIQNTVSLVIRAAAQLIHPTVNKNLNMFSVTVELGILTLLA